MSSPYITDSPGVSIVMGKVLLALVPAIAVAYWLWGPPVLVTLTLASITALGAEAAMLGMRGRPVKPYLMDGSALLTAWLLALSIPPLAPWWLVVVGAAFAVVVSKHLYGGLGNNPFNPAMVGYCVLIISFPVQMTHWLAPASLGLGHLDWPATLNYMFFDQLPAGLKFDAITSATPLDTVKTQLHLDKPLTAIMLLPGLDQESGKWMTAAYFLGGIYLLKERIIGWHVPLAFVGTLALLAGVFHLFDPARFSSPLFHLFGGATMIGAFFILTDPVTGPTTPRGKLIFAAGAAFITYFIRNFGGYPDGVAFSVLFMNICVPLIDAYTQPPVFGRKK